MLDAGCGEATTVVVDDVAGDVTACAVASMRNGEGVALYCWFRADAWVVAREIVIRETMRRRRLDTHMKTTLIGPWLVPTLVV